MMEVVSKPQIRLKGKASQLIA